MWDGMFKSVDLLQKGLSAAWTRNAIIRNNIANVETPDFKASDLEFESLMAQALEGGTGFRGTKTHERHINIGSGYGYTAFEDVQPRIYKRNDTSMRFDGNNVDIESENVKLAQNSLLYNALIEKMNSELRRLTAAITDTR